MKTEGKTRLFRDCVRACFWIGKWGMGMGMMGWMDGNAFASLVMVSEGVGRVWYKFIMVVLVYIPLFS